jgi:predicted Ser/Thr protein kinase
MRESYTINELISKTKQTLIFKATYKGTIVAIKVYRKPRVKEFTNAWKNEFKILKRLNYISKIIEYTSLLSLHFNRHLLLNL